MPPRRLELTAGVMTILLVLAGWVLLSLPLALLFGTLCGHQRRHAAHLRGLPAYAAPPRVPAQSGSAA